MELLLPSFSLFLFRREDKSELLPPGVGRSYCIDWEVLGLQHWCQTLARGPNGNPNLLLDLLVLRLKIIFQDDRSKDHSMIFNFGGEYTGCNLKYW